MSDIKFKSNKDFILKFNSLIEQINKDPIENFIKHPWFLDFPPTPAQTVALKSVFGQPLDGVEFHRVWMECKDEHGNFDLKDEWMTETQLYKYMTGTDYDVMKIKVRNKINFIVGRRGGKTTLAAMLAIFCAIKLNWKPYLHKTPYATVLILSHSKEFSDEVLEIIRGFIMESPILSRLINKRKKNTASTMNLSIPFLQKDGKVEYSRVQIKVGAASSKTTRGVAACAVLCDEIAFWNLDENLKESDEKVLKAVRPATKQFGRKSLLIKLSSPGIKQGVIFNEWGKWRDGTLPGSYVCLKASSWVWNTILPKEEFIEEEELDPDGFDSEYRGNFVDSLSNFIQPEFVDLAIMNGVRFNPPEDKRSTVSYSAAIDAAYKGDVFTFSLVGHFENRIKQYVVKGFEGSRKNPVKAHEVAKFVRTICKEYDVQEVAADQYSFQPLREIFEQYGITLVEHPFTLTFKKQIYFNLKRLIHSQQMDLLDNETLKGELKSLVVEQTPSGQIRIGHPQGGTDDYADATAISAYLAVEKAGQLGYDFQSNLGPKDYDIKTDVHGTAFTAPSAEMLADSYGYDIFDNSSDYVKHPKTGKLVRRSTLEDEEDEDIDPSVLF